MKKFQKIIPFFFIFFLFSCHKSQEENTNISSTSKGHLKLTFNPLSPPSKNSKFQIVFSHNIQGELRPCGCRFFPLGGISQVAGALQKIKQEGEFIYLDLGDLFFPHQSIPIQREKSLKYTAQFLAQEMKQLGLSIFIPGEIDFSAGDDFLFNLIKSNSLVPIIGNLPKSELFKYSWIQITLPTSEVFLTSILSPELISKSSRLRPTPPQEALIKIIEEMKKNGYQNENPKHRLILLSHQGMEDDYKISKIFPQFDWIIGSHSQSFTKEPFLAEKTNIVQVLSKNHYLGKIDINYTKDKSEDRFNLIEIGPELEKELSPNPHSKSLSLFLDQLKEIELEEQNDMVTFPHEKVRPIPTYGHCMDCHSLQATHWMKTSHALAMVTMFNKNVETNLECVKCHALGVNQKTGFSRFKDFVQFSPKEEIEKNNIKPSLSKEWSPELNLQNYLKEFREIFTNIPSVRNAGPIRRKELLEKWIKLDERYHATNNFSNVQCLNCHTHINSDHPFTFQKTAKIERDKRNLEIKSRCLECHTPDQDPDWYLEKTQTSSTGAPLSPTYQLKDSIFQHAFSQQKCPIGNSK